MLHSKGLAQHGCQAAYGWLLLSRQGIATTTQTLLPRFIPRVQRSEVVDEDRRPSTSNRKSQEPPDFAYNPAVPAKLPYAVMRNVLHNKEVYLEDAKLARFLTARRATQFYGLKLDASRTLAMVLGNVTRRTLLRLYDRSRRIGLPDRRWRLVTAIESRLDMTVLRMGLCHNIRVARDLVRHGRLTLNGNPATLGNISVRPGDVLSVLPKHKAFMQDQLAQDLAGFMAEMKQPPVAVQYRAPAVPVQLSSPRPGERMDRVRLRLGPVVRMAEHKRAQLRIAAEALGAAQARGADNKKFDDVIQQALNPTSPFYATQWQSMDRRNPFRKWDSANFTKSHEERQRLAMHKLLTIYSPATQTATNKTSTADGGV